MNAPSATPALGEQSEPVEPLSVVLGLDRRDHFTFVVGLLVALVLHGTAGSRAFVTLPHLSDLAGSVRTGIRERLRAQIDIEVEKEPPPPAPEPEPEPKPEPEPEPPPPPPLAEKEPPPPTETPPAAAEAGKVLTQEPDPDEPVDLTGEGFVTGPGDRFVGGVTARAGTSKQAVRDVAAAPTGIGTGQKGPPGPPTPRVDLSKPPMLSGSSMYWDDCPFPAEADAEGINTAKVQIVVTVGVNGRAKSVTVVKDYGYGFGAQARQCALRKTYSPGLNAEGKPVEKSTGPMNITFRR